jgi:hypothetical protein
VVTGVQLFEPLACYMGVDLRRGQVAVAKQELDHTQIGTVI